MYSLSYFLYVLCNVKQRLILSIISSKQASGIANVVPGFDERLNKPCIHRLGAGISGIKIVFRLKHMPALCMGKHFAKASNVRIL